MSNSDNKRDFQVGDKVSWNEMKSTRGGSFSLTSKEGKVAEVYSDFLVVKYKNGRAASIRKCSVRFLTEPNELTESLQNIF